MINSTYKKPFFTSAPSSEAYLGDLKSDGTVALTANWDVGAYTLTALRFISNQATGTAPFTVASTTRVENLNVHRVSGYSFDQSVAQASSPYFENVDLVGRRITAGSGTGLTVNTPGNVNRQVYKVTVTYAGFSAAATTADKTIATLPAKTKIVGFYADTTVAFTGGAVSATALTVGKSAGGVEYIATHDVFTAAINRGAADADMGTELTRAAAIQGGAIVNWAATTTVSARITTTSANTDALTAGSVTFYIVTERY